MTVSDAIIARNRANAKKALKHKAGSRLGMLTITERMGKKAKVLCDCGNEKIVYISNMVSGATKSCGCLFKKTNLESLAKGRESIASKARYSAREDEFWIWRSMIKRCTLKTDKSYKNYGGRGITVCDRWKASYDAFLDDMGFKPFSNATLDRIDNDKGYSPENCRWSTYAEQNRNKRTNVNIEYNGVTMCLEDWAKSLKISPASLNKRLKRWTLEEALTTPKYGERKK